MIDKKTIGVVDYGIGNLYSVQNALNSIGLSSIITSDAEIISKSDALILPGVGAFGDAMNNMGILGLADPIKRYIESGKPFMGICLGLQLLFTESEEFGIHKGLDIIKGKVVKFTKDDNCNLKVPQVCWNQIYKKGLPWENTELNNIRNGEFMYFVHSYYVVPEDDNDVLSLTNYEGIEYCSSIKKDNVFACQFHPENSNKEGIKILQNFKQAIMNNKSERY